MQISDWVGYAAATLTTASFVPQALHTFRTKDVRGISLAMYSAFVVGILLWLVYGLMRTADGRSPIAAPAVGASLAAFVIVYFTVFGIGIWYMLRMMAQTPGPHVVPPASAEPTVSARLPADPDEAAKDGAAS